MASAKQGYPVVSRLLGRKAPTGLLPATLLGHLNEELRAVVHKVDRLTPTIVEVVVKAPMAARAFPSWTVLSIAEFRDAGAEGRTTTLAMEGLALRGACRPGARAAIDHRTGDGGSSDLCALLQPGEPVI